jgi:glycosyltransferase involved in cell wall biosynthesis
MHILFLTDNFPPEVNAPATRTHEHCRAWVSAGHRVTVITCAPNFPKGKVFDGYRNRLWQREAIDGIDVVRVWSYITANEGFLRRTLDYVSFMLTATPAALAIRNVDIVVTTSPQFFCPCAGYMASVLKRCPWVFELRDLWPESIRAVGAMQNGRLLDWLERLELFLYRRAAAVVAVTEPFKQNLIERGIEPAKIHVVMNGADMSRFSPRPRDASLARDLDLEGRVVAGYVGTHGMAHGLSTVLAAADLVRKSPGGNNVRFLLLGDGAEKASLQMEAGRLGLDNVLFLDTVPRNEVARYWSLLDISIIHLRRTELFKTVVPSKLFECMAMGLPVLHGVEGESADIVRHYDVGLTFAPEDAGSLARSVLELAADPDRRRQLGRNGIVAAASFDRAALAKRMLDVLLGVVDNSRPSQDHR